MNSTFPQSELVNLDAGVKWKPISGEGEDDVGEELLLPRAFGDAAYHRDENQRATVSLSFHGELPTQWELITDGDDQLFFDAEQWNAL